MDRYPVYEADEFLSEEIPIYLNINTESIRNKACMHKHDFIEIAYVFSGRGTHAVAGIEYSVSKGSLCIINHDTTHVFISDSENEDKLVVYNCVFLPGFIDHSLIDSEDFLDIADFLMFGTFFHKEKPFIQLELKGIRQTEIEDIFRKMQAEYFTKEKGYINFYEPALLN